VLKMLKASVWGSVQWDTRKLLAMGLCAKPGRTDSFF